VANLQEALEKANVPPAAQTYLSQPLTATLCNKPGIRYAGSTTQGMEICFTLNAERTKWIEIGFKYECASSVGEVTANTSAESYDEGPGPLADGSRITATGFEATIAGARASGVLATAESCEMKTLTWSARRAP